MEGNVTGSVVGAPGANVTATGAKVGKTAGNEPDEVGSTDAMIGSAVDGNTGGRVDPAGTNVEETGPTIG